MKTTNLKKMLRLSAVAAGLMSAGAAYALTLPPVSSCGLAPPNDNLLCYSPEPGVQVYVASAHDDFISYSVNALTQLSSGFGYTELEEWGSLPSFGSGQIVKLFTFNQSNNDPFPDATTGTGDHDSGPDADQTGTGDGLYMGEWPIGEAVTVGEMQAFLGEDIYSPVFSFDLNNTDTLGLNGQLQVRTDVFRDADGNVVSYTLVDVFAFDNIFNSAYDETSFVPATDKLIVTWFDIGNPNCDETQGWLCTMNVVNNVGSGKPDFFAYAPLFNLNNYDDSYELYFQLRMIGLDSGGEELSLVNVVQLPPPVLVPEPGVLALLGIGLLGLGASRRRSSRA